MNLSTPVFLVGGLLAFCYGTTTEPPTGERGGSFDQGGFVGGPLDGVFTFVQDLGFGTRTIAKSILTDLVISAAKNSNITAEMGCKVICGTFCKIPVVEIVCPFVCSDRCMRSKRSIKKYAKSDEHLLPMPNLFAIYDMNEDGVVSPKELAYVTHQDAKEEGFIIIFDMADINGDKVLSPKELYEGPFVFEMDVSDSDKSYCQYVNSRANRQASKQPELSQGAHS